MIGIRLKTLISAFALMLLAGPALADAIDGNWCHSDGRRFTIRGPEIVTPGGKHMEGNYGRHSFSYTVPAPEPGAGPAAEPRLHSPEEAINDRRRNRPGAR